MTGIRKYKPYGGKRGGNDYSFEPNYTGQRLDDTGLLYYNARYYDPLLGQFLSPDPISPDPTDVFAYNRYLYRRGNPVKYNDPSGHLPCRAAEGNCMPSNWNSSQVLQEWQTTSAQQLEWSTFLYSKWQYEQYLADTGAYWQDLETVLSSSGPAAGSAKLRMASAGFYSQHVLGQNEQVIFNGGPDVFAAVMAEIYSGPATIAGMAVVAGKQFDKLGIPITEHFRYRLAERASTRGITEADALRAYMLDTIHRVG